MQRLIKHKLYVNLKLKSNAMILPKYLANLKFNGVGVFLYIIINVNKINE